MPTYHNQSTAFEEKWYKGKGYPYETSDVIRFVNTSDMASQSNLKPYGSGTGDNGGPWRLLKTVYKVSPARLVNHPIPFTASFTGPVVCGGPTTNYTPPSWQPQYTNDLDMFSKGNTLMSRSLPTNPTFSLAQFLGELREGVPHIIGNTILRDRTHFLRNSGKEYLNAEFGWAPMMTDVRHFALQVKNSHKILKQYVKSSGSKIRRRREFPVSVQTQEFRGSLFPIPTVINEFLDGSIIYTSTEKYWFSGAFRYYLPVDDTAMSKFALWEAEANKLLGIELTPQVLWELAPWSWAIDWFTNTGDIINNVASMGQDGLVMQYGYVMHSSEYTEDRIATIDGINSYFRIESTVRQRLPAEPYGFGVDLGGLSNSQVAILAALGLSRL